MKRAKKPWLIWSQDIDDSGPQKIGYARVSTDDQNLDLQVDALKRAGCLNIYGEYKSGASRNRPQLDRAIADLRPGDTMVVWRLDRFARSGSQLFQRLDAINERGAGFRSLQENFDFSTTTGRFVLGILGLVAELERQLTIERTKAGVASRQARGLPHGAPIKFTNKKRELAKQLLRKKLTIKDVAKRLKLSPNTIGKWRKAKMPMLPKE